MNEKWVKEHLGIDKSLGRGGTLAKLKEHELNSTSWVLDTVDEFYPGIADEYRKNIKNETCSHGFLKDCPYCKWGTD